MREIVLDTETTGLSHQNGDRIIEIGAVEISNYMPTGKTYHVYLNPERAVSKDAEAVHGLSDKFLADKKKFINIAQEFIDFIGSSPLVIHNAPFDLGFLNAELGRINMPKISSNHVIDTLTMAREKFPGAQVSLDALCRRFGVDNTGREKHGALLDAEILANVYLELVGGRQLGFGLNASERKIEAAEQKEIGVAKKRPTPLAPRITQEEQAAHKSFLEKLGPKSLWSKFRQD